MELRQLQYFVAVAEELHFGRAAKRVHISQPPLSMQIRNLEEELGAQLFTRTSRRVELTEAGKLFLKDVRRILKDIESTVKTTQDTARGVIGRLAVGFVSPAMDTFLPPAILDFRRQYPGIVLSLSELLTNEQLESLYSGRIQVGFVRVYHHDLQDLCHEIVWREPYVLALPEKHPLAAKEEVALSELKGEPMIMYSRGIQPALYDAILACCEKAGFRPEIAQEARSKHTTTALVAAGLGVAIVPESSKMLRREGVKYLPMKDPLPTVAIAMIWSGGDDPPPLTRFLETVRRYCLE